MTQAFTSTASLSADQSSGHVMIEKADRTHANATPKAKQRERVVMTGRSQGQMEHSSAQQQDVGGSNLQGHRQVS